MRRGFLAVVALLAIALIAWPAAAQRVTGQVAGTCRDDTGGVLPGVTVSLSGENVVGTRTAVSSEKGFYRFLNLPPGSYDLAFNLDGFKPENQNGVRVSLGKTTTVNVVLEIGGIEEAITVIADTQVVDTTSNEVGVNYGRDWVANAPVQRQSFNDLVAAAPGSLRGGDQSARTMVYGSSYDENSFQLDGADVNDNFFNEQQAETNVDIIAEVEVLSLGAPAEYGNLTGAVYNIVTRQGTNQFHGDVNYFTQTDGLTSTNTGFEDDGGFPYMRDEFDDFSVQIGGPLAKDRLWFFASYNKQEDGFLETGVDPAIGPAAQNFDDAERVFLKANLQITESQSAVFSYNIDEHSETVGIDADSSPSTAFKRDTETPTPSLGYTAVLSDTTLLDVRATGFRAEVFLGPADPGAPLREPRFIALDTGFISGGHYYFYDLEPTRTTINAKLSHLADDFLGASHDFRFGVQYNESSAGGLYGYNDLILTYGPGYDYGYGYTRANFSYSGNTEAIGFFVDDTVRVNERLTLNLGVRYDENRAFSEAQDELDENGVPTGVRFPEFEHYTWEYVSPRLGFNYQLTPDGRTVLKGHFGRYHRAIATGEFANVIGPSIKPVFGGFYDLTTNSFFEDTLFQLTDNSNLLVDPNYKSPRTDQFIISLERRLKNNIGLSLNLVKKRGRDFAAWEDVGGIYESVTWIEGDYDLDGSPDLGVDPLATGNPLTLFRLIGGDRVFVITNRPEMDTDIEAASLILNKPMSNKWSLVASATYLKSEGRTPDSGGPTDVQQRGGLQFRTFGRNPNDFVNSGGRLRGDLPFQLKTQLVYQLPRGFLVSANLSHRDGANRVRRVRPPRSVTELSTQVLGEERGNFGRLPSQTLLDVRLEKVFTFADDVELALSADIFNALNDDSYEGVRSSNATSSVFNLPDAFVLPRRVMLGGKLRF